MELFEAQLDIHLATEPLLGPRVPAPGQLVPVVTEPGVAGVGAGPEREHVLVKILDLLGLCKRGIV